jgi:hypothetical protein
MQTSIWCEKTEHNLDLEDEDRVRITQAVFSGLVVCISLFILVMTLRSYGVRLDQHTTAPVAYSFYMVFLSGVWCIGWALWWRNCSIYVEAIHIKDEECGDSIPLNVTGLTQVASLLFNTYSFAGFSFAPSIPCPSHSVVLKLRKYIP